MEEECKQLDQVIMDISLFLFDSYYIRRVERFGLVQLYVLIEGEEAKLKEVFYHYGHLDVENRHGKIIFMGIKKKPADADNGVTEAVTKLIVLLSCNRYATEYSIYSIYRI